MNNVYEIIVDYRDWDETFYVSASSMEIALSYYTSKLASTDEWRRERPIKSVKCLGEINVAIIQ